MYGLEVCKSLKLPEDFLNTAFNIRMKYHPEEGSMLSLKSSHFNSQKVMNLCEKCKKNVGKEVHHLQHQNEANENGIINKDGKVFHKNNVANLITLCEADITTKNSKLFDRYHNNFKIVREKIISIEEKDHLRNFQPPVSGKVIMKYYGLRPSRVIGTIKESIKEAILDGEIPNKFESAFEKMKEEGEKIGLKPHE